MAVPPVILAALRRRRPIPRARSLKIMPRAPFHGRVVRVPDGDGCTVALARDLVPVRLYGIDAPEWGQPAARAAWLFLSRAILNQSCYFVPQDIDRYGRLVCDCYPDSGVLVALSLLSRGLAWYTPLYAPNRPEFCTAQKIARQHRLNIWRQPNPTPPWVFRHAHKRR